MLRVQLTPRRALFVSLTDDTFPNKGGYYCQVFEDEDGKCERDTFTISKHEIAPSITDNTERRKKAMVIANQRVKQMYC